MFSITILNILVLVLGIFLFLNFFKRNKKSPPGPTAFPILGNILQICRDPNKTLLKWCKEFGPIFSIKILSTKIVFVNDSKWIKEILNNENFNGKPQNHIFTIQSRGVYGLMATEGEAWEAHRRFTLRGLRDFGFSKSSMEGLINEEISEILDWFSQNDGKTVSVTHGFSSAVSNSLWLIVNGKRNKHRDSEVEDLLHELLRSAEVAFGKGLFLIPWLRHIIPEASGYNTFVKATDNLHGFIVKAIAEHKRNFVEDNEPRDFIDLYLQEIRNAEPGSSFYKEIGEKHMEATIVDLFIAGNETTSVTIAWAMLFLAHHPNVQKSLQTEIDRVSGNSRRPLLSDRANMPYTEAVILEVLRRSTLVPFGLPHRAIQDGTFRGYLIEKNTFIIANLQHVMTNPEVWGDPENFRPERFLNQDGTGVLKNENLIPFQAGKRQCLGEGLAKDTLFLFLSSILQQFEVLPDPKNPVPDYSPKLAFINEPKPFEVLLRQRHT